MENVPTRSALLKPLFKTEVEMHRKIMLESKVSRLSFGSFKELAQSLPKKDPALKK